MNNNTTATRTLMVIAACMMIVAAFFSTDISLLIARIPTSFIMAFVTFALGGALVGLLHLAAEDKEIVATDAFLSNL